MLNKINSLGKECLDYNLNLKVYRWGRTKLKAARVKPSGIPKKHQSGVWESCEIEQVSQRKMFAIINALPTFLENKYSFLVT